MSYEPLADIRGRAEQVAMTLTDDAERDIFWKTIDRIDVEEAARIQAKWADVFTQYDRTGPYKYADLPYWIAHKAKMARTIGLDRSPPLKILDIGMGAGHFAAVCQALGHTVVGTDIVEPIYEDICALLKVDRRIEPSALRKPLPDLGQRFDLVTIIWQVFHIIDYLPNGDRVHWTPEDWGFLFDDLAFNQLNEAGRIYVQLNPNVSSTGESFDAQLMDWCAANGAKVRAETGVIEIRDARKWRRLARRAGREIAGGDVARAPSKWFSRLTEMAG